MTSSDSKTPANDSTTDDWAEAMAEQQGASPAADVDPWAEALAEQAAASDNDATGTGASPAAASGNAAVSTAGATASAARASATSGSQATAAPAQTLFKPLGEQGAGTGSDIDMIMDVPVQLTVELGRTRLTIKNLLQLGQGSVVELDGLAGEPMDIFVNGYLIAQGEVVVVDDKYGIRLTDIITPSERLNRLSTRR